MKNIFLFLFSIILIFSCEKEQEIVTINFNYGDYDAISMTSNIPIDANFDGVYSTDFMEEFLLESIRNRSSLKFYQLGDTNESSFSIFIPTMYRFPPEFETNTTTILNKGAFFSISNVDGNIISTTPIVDRHGEPTATKITGYNIIDDETIEITFKHTLIYNIQTAKWLTISVNGVYKKR